MFSHLSSSLWTLFKVLACYAISGKRLFAVSLMKSLKSWRPWGHGYGLLHISYKVWKTSLTKQIGYLRIHKIQAIIIEENTKALSPSNQQVFSLNACLWLLILTVNVLFCLLDNLKIQIFTFIKTSNKYSKILVFKCSVNVLFSFRLLPIVLA